MWAWVELKYADGFTLVFDSAEWGDVWDKQKARPITREDLAPENRAKLDLLPDPAPLLTFGEAVRARKPAGGNSLAACHTITAIHLANLAIRVGRKIQYDPQQHRIIGDEQANRLINPPMRAPWHI